MIGSANCPYCSKMKNITFSDKEVISKLEKEYVYIAIDSESGMLGAPEYNWIEINGIDPKLNLTDDSIIENIDLWFQFQYYG